MTQTLQEAVNLLFDFRFQQMTRADAMMDEKAFNDAREIVKIQFVTTGNAGAAGEWAMQGIVHDLDTLKKHGLLSQEQAAKLEDKPVKKYASVRKLLRLPDLAPKVKALLARVDATKLKGIYSQEFREEEGKVAKELMREQTLKTLRAQFGKASEKDVQIVEEYLMAYELDKQGQA